MNYDELAFQISACNRRRIYQLEEIDRQISTVLASVDKRIENLNTGAGNLSQQVSQNTNAIASNGQEIQILERDLRQVSLALTAIQKFVQLNQEPDIPTTVSRRIDFLGGIDTFADTNINADLTVTGNASVGTDLDVTGNATVDTDLTVSGNADVNSVLTVTGNTNLNSDLSVSGNADVGTDLTVTGNTDLNSDLEVSGSIGINTGSPISRLDIDGNIYLQESGFGENKITWSSSILQDGHYIGYGVHPTFDPSNFYMTFAAREDKGFVWSLYDGNGRSSEPLAITGSGNSRGQLIRSEFDMNVVGNHTIDGNLGVGITSPGFKADINGDVFMQQGGIDGYKILWNNSPSLAGHYIGYGRAPSFDSGVEWYQTFAGNSNEGFVWVLYDSGIQTEALTLTGTNSPRGQLLRSEFDFEMDASKEIRSNIYTNNGNALNIIAVSPAPLITEADNFEHIFPKDDGSTDTFNGTDETDNHGFRIRPPSGVSGGGIQLMFGTDSSNNISYCKTYRSGVPLPCVYDNPLRVGSPSPPVSSTNFSVTGFSLLESARIGPWRMEGRNGNISDTFAQLAHQNRSNNSDYCLLQEDTGETFINCASGTTIKFRQNNNDLVVADSTSWRFNQTIDMQSNGDVDSVNNLNVSSIDSNNNSDPINCTQTMDFEGLDNVNRSARFFNSIFLTNDGDKTDDLALLIWRYDDGNNNPASGNDFDPHAFRVRGDTSDAIEMLVGTDKTIQRPYIRGVERTVNARPIRFPTGIDVDNSAGIEFDDSDVKIDRLGSDMDLSSKFGNVFFAPNTDNTNGFIEVGGNTRIGGGGGAHMANTAGSLFLLQEDDTNNTTEVNDANDNDNATFNVGGTKNFRVQDKENGRIIKHSCVESNRGTQCVYRFDVQTKDGKAKVSLPDYFSWLNYTDAHVYCQPDGHFGIAYGKIERMNQAKPKPGKPGGRLSIFSNQDGPYQVMVVVSRDVEFREIDKPEGGKFGPNPGQKRKSQARGKRKQPG